MDLIICYQTKNAAYLRNRKIKPVGIIVHSTGANNPYCKRYVDFPERLGTNLYGNHWNKETATKSMHGFIGYDKDKKIVVCNTQPYDRACWGVGGGSKGSYNYDPHAYLQFEICEDDLKNPDYYWRVMDVAEDYCAYLCTLFQLPVREVIGHYEAAQRGYGSNHSDPKHWMDRYGDSMDKFRQRVAAKLAYKEPDTKPNPQIPVVTSNPYIYVTMTKKENTDFYDVPEGTVLKLDLEEYLRGVVPAEIGNAHIEACKAQAVCARTAAIKQNATTKDRAVTDKSTFQSYRSIRNDASKYGNAVNAVTMTKGQIMTYDGKVIDCWYSHSNGGHLYVPEKVWKESRPYYKEGEDSWTTEEKRGHGIGLSQMGAIRAATEHKLTYRDILARYYPSTTIVDDYNSKPTTVDPVLPPIVEEEFMPYNVIVNTSKANSLNLWKNTKKNGSYGTIPKGTVLTVLSEEGKWSKITYNGNTGYCDSQYLVRVDLGGTPSTPIEDTETKAKLGEVIKLLQEIFIRI